MHQEDEPTGRNGVGTSGPGLDESRERRQSGYELKACWPDSVAVYLGVAVLLKVLKSSN